MHKRKIPEPGGCYIQIASDLACCMGLDGVIAVGESHEAAVQVHEQCQGAAGGGCSPQKELGRETCWDV